MLGKEAEGKLEGVEIGAIDASEAEEAVGVLSRGMRDNPLHVAVFGSDPQRRERRLRRLFGGAFAAMGWPENMLAARGEDGGILGVCAVAPPGECTPNLSRQLRILPALLLSGPRSAARTAR